MLATLAVVLSGCGLLRAPQQVVRAVVPTDRSKTPDPNDLQLQLQRFTDDFTARVGHALDEYAALVGTEAARTEALRMKLAAGASVISIASGPNPSANLLDMVSVSVLTRMNIEDHWTKTKNGAAFEPWLQVSRLMETNVWRIAAGVLKPAQVDELRVAINTWYAQNPEARDSFYARPHEFASMVRGSQGNVANQDSVFSLASLDPTSGLDPAVREVTKTRLFAERAMFTAQRMPFLLRIQVELLALELTQQAQVQQLLTNTTSISESADRLSRAAENVSQTASELPDRISAERKAILTALEQQEGKLKELVVEVDRSLVDAGKMSGSLSITITNFDALMKRFGVGEPDTNSVPDTNSQPFNILDYGKTAAQIGAMANDLNTLITSVNQSIPQASLLSQQAGAEARLLVDHSFRLGLILIVVLLAGAVLAGLAYRFMVMKWIGHEGRSSRINPPEK